MFPNAYTSLVSLVFILQRFYHTCVPLPMHFLLFFHIYNGGHFSWGPLCVCVCVCKCTRECVCACCHFSCCRVRPVCFDVSEKRQEAFFWCKTLVPMLVSEVLFCFLIYLFLLRGRMVSCWTMPDGPFWCFRLSLDLFLKCAFSFDLSECIFWIPAAMQSSLFCY